MNKNFLIAFVAGVSIGQVVNAEASNWRTFYDRPISTFETNKWNISDIDVTINKSSKVVWYGKGTGSASGKIKSLVKNAAQLGSQKLKGRRDVALKINVLNFSSPTPKIRRNQRTDLGVHHVNLSIKINDLRSGAVLLPSTVIEADLEALTGAFALAFEAQRQGQKERVTQHLASVFQGFLGQGPDPRRGFKRYAN
jgi:hypothetical protein